MADRLIRITTALAVLTVAVIAAVISYRHAGAHPPISEPLKPPAGFEPDAPGTYDPAGPDGNLRAILANAPEDGIPVAHLIQATGMSRPTLYRRLGELIQSGTVIQIGRGRYRAARTEGRDRA